MVRPGPWRGRHGMGWCGRATRVSAVRGEAGGVGFGSAGLGQAGPGRARRGRRGSARRVPSGQCWSRQAWLGLSSTGKVRRGRRGVVRHGKVGRGLVRFGRLGKVRFVPVGLVVAVARLVAVWHGMAGVALERLGKAVAWQARPGSSGLGWSWRGRQGSEWRGPAGQGVARFGVVRRGRLRKARHGAVWQAWKGWSSRGKPGLGEHWRGRHGPVRLVEAR